MTKTISERARDVQQRTLRKKLRALEMREEGKTLKEIAGEFGVSHQRVSQWMRELASGKYDAR